MPRLRIGKDMRAVGRNPLDRARCERQTKVLMLEPQVMNQVLEAQALPCFEYVRTNILPEVSAQDTMDWHLRPAVASSSYFSPDGRLLALVARNEVKPSSMPLAVFEHGQQRVVRAGVSVMLEVFWHSSATGWGVRSLEDLQVGQFICEYAGEVLSDVEVESRCLAPEGRDAYLFNLTTLDQCRLLGARAAPPSEHPDFSDNLPVFVIDAFARGNIGRFLNHACGPSAAANVTPVFVFTEDEGCESIDLRLPRVAFFANRHIDCGEELRYDYEMRPEEVDDADGIGRSLPCHCASEACRGRIY